MKQTMDENWGCFDSLIFLKMQVYACTQNFPQFLLSISCSQFEERNNPDYIIIIIFWPYSSPTGFIRGCFFFWFVCKIILFTFFSVFKSLYKPKKIESLRKTLFLCLLSSPTLMITISVWDFKWMFSGSVCPALKLTKINLKFYKLGSKVYVG